VHGVGVGFGLGRDSRIIGIIEAPLSLAVAPLAVWKKMGR
jgi:hypothetical protein